MKDNDPTKLPKWAQERISQLENSVVYYKEKLRQQNDGDSEVWIRDSLDVDQALPKGTAIVFKLPNGDVEAMVRDDQLELMGSASQGHYHLSIMPRSSNVAWVRVVDR